MRTLLLLLPALLAADEAHQRQVVRTDPTTMAAAMKKQKADHAKAVKKQKGKSQLPQPATVQTVPNADKMMKKSRSKDRRPQWGNVKPNHHR